MSGNYIHKKYEIEINVEPADIDQLGHVNNTVYLRWIQDVAVAHWNAEASEIDKKKLLWVVVRHEIDYKRPALLEDKIITRTWVGQALNRNFERHTEIIRKSDMKLLVKARTLWCPIDAKTKKPTDVSEEVFKRFSTNSSNQK